MGYGNSRLSSSRFEMLPRQPSTGTAEATITSGVGVYGSLATLATSSFDYDGITLVILPGNPARYRITVTANYNGGGDEPIITDVYMASQTGPNYPSQIDCPIFIPKGSVLKAKCWASSGAANSFQLVVVGYQGDARSLRGFRQVVSCTDWSAADAANSITLTGTTPTAWTTTQAATTTRLGGIRWFFDQFSATLPNLYIRFDVGVGPSGSEVPLFSHMLVSSGGTPQILSPWYPCDIPAGSRLATRAVASGASTIVIGSVLAGLAA